jgi:hypothetical protein
VNEACELVKLIGQELDHIQQAMPAVYLAEAQRFSQRGKYKEALVLYEKVLQHDETSAAALRGAGVAQQHLGSLREAIYHFEEIERMGFSPSTLDYLAGLYKQLIKDLEGKLCYVLKKRGKKELEQELEFERAERIVAQNRIIDLQTKVCYLSLAYDDAVEDLNRLENEQLTDLRQRIHDLEQENSTLLHEIDFYHGDPGAIDIEKKKLWLAELDIAAQQYMKDGKYETAIRILQPVIESAIAREEGWVGYAHKKIGESYLRLEDPDMAVTHLKEAVGLFDNDSEDYMSTTNKLLEEAERQLKSEKSNPSLGRW